MSGQSRKRVKSHLFRGSIARGDCKCAVDDSAVSICNEQHADRRHTLPHEGNLTFECDDIVINYEPYSISSMSL